MSSLKTRFAGEAAKKLRANSTDAERLLWSRLRDRRLLGAKFVRQLPIGRFVADFACRERDLVIELDGGQHGAAGAAISDAERSRAIAENGYSVIRFWNTDVLTNLEGVLTRIVEAMEKASSPGLRFAKPGLSPEGEVNRGAIADGFHTAITGTPT